MFYLGITAAEMAKCHDFPGKIAYMACHFSPSSRGISNIPKLLPPGSLLLLDDSLPPVDHDPEVVVRELSQAARHFGCSGVYLDFQREGYPISERVSSLAEALPCPVAVSTLYAPGNNLAVVLPPVAADVPVKSHLAPWTGRQLWLEVSLKGKKLTLTRDGCQEAPLVTVPQVGFQDQKLHCHYRAKAGKDVAAFELWRTWEDLQALIRDTQEMGVIHTLGLWQELGAYLK